MLVSFTLPHECWIAGLLAELASPTSPTHPDQPKKLPDHTDHPKVFEYNGNARTQCWNTVEMHTSSAESFRNARMEVLVYSRSARTRCWNTVGMRTTLFW